MLESAASDQRLLVDQAATRAVMIAHALLIWRWPAASMIFLVSQSAACAGDEIGALEQLVELDLLDRDVLRARRQNGSNAITSSSSPGTVATIERCCGPRHAKRRR